MDQETEAGARRRIWMKRGAVAGLALTFVAVTLVVAPRVRARGGLGGVGFTKGAYCAGAYADDFAALSPAAREAEQKPQSQSWVYAIRTTATYECLSYSGDGNVRRVRRKALAHGTGFGYRQQNGETYILTNQHVAEWPAVTDDEHKVDDVPPGCKRISDAVRIVESERDTYDRDDIPLLRVVTDKSMDMTVLKAHALLPILPWKVGRSADLKERNVVDVRGFPLGAFKATNVGKVVSTYDHDDEKDWDHVDFVVDAQLSPGNSGSPVLGVSCRTGEFELVGVYHAGYAGNTPLNVVVAIDQVRDMMTTLKKSPRRERIEVSALDRKARTRLVSGLEGAIDPFFPFDGAVAVARARTDGALIFEVMSPAFPVRSSPALVLEDLPEGQPEGFGELGRVWVGGRFGLKAYPKGGLDADGLVLVERVLDALRANAGLALELRTAQGLAARDREHYEHMGKLERQLRRGAAAQTDLASSMGDLVERLSPKVGETTVSLAEAYVPLAPPTPGKNVAQGPGMTEASPQQATPAR
ncbi:MAG: serine protease [Myxococcaceae bacterium]|nr:MAG: serine protease [Myxococcaceae bacterium]